MKSNQITIALLIMMALGRFIAMLNFAVPETAVVTLVFALITVLPFLMLIGWDRVLQSRSLEPNTKWLLVGLFLTVLEVLGIIYSLDTKYMMFGGLLYLAYISLQLVVNHVVALGFYRVFGSKKTKRNHSHLNLLEL